MPALLRRPRLLVSIGVVVVVLVAVLAVALARSRTPDCTVARPDLNLPPQLRTLGEFDQPFDTNDPRTLDDAAVKAATALHADLAGASVGEQVRETAVAPAQHDALVLTLRVQAGTNGGSRLVGLVAFLLDCSSRAYYDDVDDLLRTDPGSQPANFPRVRAGAAAAQLGTSSTLLLVYRDSPFKPLWKDPSTGNTVPAEP